MNDEIRLRQEILSAFDRADWAAREALLTAIRHLVAGVLTPPVPSTRKEWVERADQVALTLAIEASGGNISATARRLGVSRVTVYRLIEKYGAGNRTEGA